MTPAEAIDAAELTEVETRYRNQLAREMYQAGYRQAEGDMAARWDEIARPVVHGPRHADLEVKRWGPDGARPPEPEPEMEIT
jgi:hypothetical protein